MLDRPITIFDICAIVLAAGLLLLDFCLTKKQKEYLKDIVYLGWTRVEFSTFSSFIIASSSVTFRLFRKLVGGDFHSVRGLSRVIAANGAIMLSAIMLMAIFADVNYGLNFDCLKPSPYVQFKCRFMYIGGAYPIQNVLVSVRFTIYAHRDNIFYDFDTATGNNFCVREDNDPSYNNNHREFASCLLICDSYLRHQFAYEQNFIPDQCSSN